MKQEDQFTIGATVTADDGVWQARPVRARSDHRLLQEGHLFGRKEVSIPICAVSNVSDGVQLSLTKAQVRDLPPVDHDRPDA